MKTLVIYLGKKYIISALNDLLAKYKDNVATVTTTIDIWIIRLQKIIESLKKINERVSDGELNEDEISESVKDIEQIIKEW